MVAFFEELLRQLGHHPQIPTYFFNFVLWRVFLSGSTVGLLEVVFQIHRNLFCSIFFCDRLPLEKPLFEANFRREYFSVAKSINSCSVLWKIWWRRSILLAFSELFIRLWIAAQHTIPGYARVEWHGWKEKQKPYRYEQKYDKYMSCASITLGWSLQNINLYLNWVPSKSISKMPFEL